MILGLAAWGLRDTPLEEQLVLAQSLDVTLVELSIANYSKDPIQLDSTESDCAKVKALYAAHGISTMCACTGNDFTGDDVAAQVDKVKTVIRLAEKLEVKLLRIFAGFSSDSVVYGARLETMLAALREIASYGRMHGVLPCVETHGGVVAHDGVLTHFASASTRVDLLERIAATGCAIQYDPANLAAVGDADPAALYGKFAGSIAGVHLKDFRDAGTGVLPATCGEGRLNWDDLLSALEDYAGPALIEYELTDDVADGMKRSLEFLRGKGVR
ncbi:MAG: sugar phosphate isomerase/epimerase [Victivallaceae bacterium]|nr:sugar phosphate isomerase/epimerase [Victivallaceae bacterium]